MCVGVYVGVCVCGCNLYISFICLSMYGSGGG